jgi:hypothetical protein
MHQLVREDRDVLVLSVRHEHVPPERDGATP